MTSPRADLLLSFLETGHDLDTEELALVVSDMCVSHDAPLTKSEALIAFDILERLYPDAQAQVRGSLAEKFALRADVPHSLIVSLANDSIDIARQVIMHSPVLNDEDLIKLIVERTRDYRAAVSVRKTVSAKVCDVLVYLGDEDVMINLAKNSGAHFSPHAFKRLVTASRTVHHLHDPLLHRPEMMPDLAALMYQWVNRSLKQYIAQNFGSSLSQILEDEIDQTTQSLMRNHTGAPSQTSGGSTSSPGADRQSSFPEAFSALVIALRRSDMETVETELRSITRLPVQSVNRILYNDNGEALAVVCRAYGVGRALYSEFFTRLHGTPPYSRFTASREHATAMNAYHRLSKQQADLILLHWHENPNSVWGDPKRFNAAWEIRKRNKTAR